MLWGMFCAHRVVVPCTTGGRAHPYLLMLVPLGTLPRTTPLTVLLSFSFELTLPTCRYRLLPILPLTLDVLAARLRSSTSIAHRSLLAPLVARLLFLSRLFRHVLTNGLSFRLSVLLRQVFAATTIRRALLSLLA